WAGLAILFFWKGSRRLRESSSSRLRWAARHSRLNKKDAAVTVEVPKESNWPTHLGLRCPGIVLWKRAGC
nr:hypothetical protein [Tanacetum cinerariifolium]